jgi:hypothetical protein
MGNLMPALLIAFAILYTTGCLTTDDILNSNTYSYSGALQMNRTYTGVIIQERTVHADTIIGPKIRSQELVIKVTQQGSRPLYHHELVTIIQKDQPEISTGDEVFIITAYRYGKPKVVVSPYYRESPSKVNYRLIEATGI